MNSNLSKFSVIISRRKGEGDNARTQCCPETEPQPPYREDKSPCLQAVAATKIILTIYLPLYPINQESSTDTWT